jgi:fatty acid desaturase
MSEKMKIKWYKTPLTKENLKMISARSNVKGLVQTLGFLSLLTVSGLLANWSILNLNLVYSIILLLIHGIYYSFILNGFHELSHNTVFKSKKLNGFFYRLFSFLSWNNHVFFSESHREHHFYTLQRDIDMEVSLPIELSARTFFLRGFINPLGLIETVYGTLLLSLGIVKGKMYSGLGSSSAAWKVSLFPEKNTKLRKKLFRWARITFFGHLLIVSISLAFGLWQIPLLLTFAPFYGTGFLYFLNPTQHKGMEDNVSDFRLNSRTILLNPILRFLYWNMNYHVEHHMYAAVPFHNLGKLHKLIEYDLPDSPKGLIQTWIQIMALKNREINATVIESVI